MIILIFSSTCCLALILKVIKQEYGSRLPWHFPITNVWRKFSKPSASARKDLLHEVELTDAPKHHHDESNDQRKWKLLHLMIASASCA